MLEATVRDNVIKFKVKDPLFVSGKFKLTDYKITKEQPFETPTDRTYEFTATNSEFNVKAGRSASKEVAEYFKDWCPVNKNTFKNKPDDLNFALRGELSLTFKMTAEVGETYTLTFADIMLAQGHSGQSNNWWFGGRNCAHIGGKKVIAVGYHTGNTFQEKYGIIQAERGGNDVNEIEIEYVGVEMPVFPAKSE